MLFVIEPGTFVVCSVSVGVGPLTFSLVIVPFAVIHVSIGMDQFAASVCLIVAPHSFIAARVRPHLYTKSVPRLTQPLPFIHRAVWETLGPLLHTTIVVRLCCDLFVLCLIFIHFLFGRERRTCKIIMILCVHSAESTWILIIILKHPMVCPSSPTFRHIFLVETLPHLVFVRVASSTFAFAQPCTVSHR